MIQKVYSKGIFREDLFIFMEVVEMYIMIYIMFANVANDIRWMH